MSYLEVISPLVLHADPVELNHAVTKRYVDNKKTSLTAQSFTTGILPVGRLPSLTGDMSSTQGTGVVSLSPTGVTPGSYPKVTIDSAGRVVSGLTVSSSDIPSIPFAKVTTGKPTTAAGYGITNLIALSGGTVSGPITTTASAESAFDAVTKFYVDDSLTGIVSGSLIVGDVVRKPTAVTPTGFLRCNGGYADRTVYTDLFNAMGYGLILNANIDYTSYAAMGVGQPWKQQYNLNTTLTGDITDWITTDPIPGPLSYAQAVVTKDRVYVLGGHDGTGARNLVYTAQINPDGTLGTWTNASPLPTALMHTKAVVTKNRVYLISGYDGSFHSPKVYTATIDIDGIIGTWSEDTALPFVLNQSQVLVTKNRIYLIGGFTNGSVATVLTAPINSDGTIGTWATGTSLPSALTNSQLIATKNRVYILTGSNGVSSTTNTVYTTTINADGTLGVWTEGAAFPIATGQCETLVTRNRVYIFGGYASGYLQSVYNAPVNADGTIGAWSLGTPMPGLKAYAQVLATSSRIYVIGGVSSSGMNATVFSAPITGSLSDYSHIYDGSINKFDGSNLTGSYTTEDQTNAVYVQPGAGRPWQQQYDINSAQSGDIANWTSVMPTPDRMAYAQTVVTKNRIYLLGGEIAGSYSSAVYFAPINNDGSIGTWLSGTPLPAAVAHSQVIVYNNRVYLIGGYTGSYSSVVYTAPIDADGVIGTWTTSTSLPVAVSHSQAVLTNNRIYLIGSMVSGANSSAVYTTQINADGTLGTWSTATALPSAVSQAQVVASKNRIYLVGGNNGSGVSSVYTATVGNNGVLSAWSTGTALPVTMFNAQALVFMNRVYLIGGVVAGAHSSAVYTAPINVDGTLGSWTTGTPIPSAMSNSQIAITKNRIYLLAGHSGTQTVATTYTAPISAGISDYSPYYDGSVKLPDLTGPSYLMPGSGQPWRQQYDINDTQNADITDWSTNINLPGVLIRSQAIVTKNRVYLLGGNNGSSYVATVYTAPINEDGTLGSWTTGTSLPGLCGNSQPVVTKNRVYLLGGYHTGFSSTVYTAPIISDGTLGSWTTASSLPSLCGNSQAILTKNRVYLMGGNNGATYLSAVYTATINSDGTLGAWTTGTALPGGLSITQAVVTKNRVYLLGGSNGTQFATVYTTPINGDGTLGTWTTGTSLPIAIANSQSVITKNRVYLLGGLVTGTRSASVYSAPINADGTLGTWTTGTSLPTTMVYNQAVTVKDKIYLLGGQINGVNSSAIYVGSFSGGLSDYSPYYDGSISPIEPTIHFKLPDFSSSEVNSINFYIKY